MNSHTGSLLRILGVMVLLVSYWLFLVGIIYSAISLIFGFELSFFNFVICFVGIIIFRSFYPKNVFV